MKNYPPGCRFGLTARMRGPMRPIAIALLFISATVATASPPPDVSTIRLPAGFRIEIFSDQVPGARSMTLAADGAVYVGTEREGRVYELRDADHNGKAEKVRIVAEGLTAPNGVAWLSGDLYIAEISRISRLKNIKTPAETAQKPEPIYHDLPGDFHHGLRYLKAGPDGKLYTTIGVPCNVCRPEKPVYGTLLRMNPDGKNLEVLATGLRNSVGFDWHPETRELWLTDNGRDYLGDDRPPDELNHLARPGSNFGFPACFGKTITDPEYGKGTDCRQFTAPEWEFPAHVAALGIHFYTGTQFPAEYRQQLLVAQHGSWNRTQPQGYRVDLIRFRDGKPVSEEPFAEGWLRPDGRVSGRPVDILELLDGSVLISDDHAGAIYRVYFDNNTHHP